MGAGMKYLETGSTDPAYNLAFEEYVLENRADGDYLMLWQNDNTIVIGQNQNAEAEINRKFVEEHGIHVVRRATGGGAVYHDLGNLNYSFISSVDDPETMTFSKFTGAVCGALEKMGVTAEASGRNDILVNGKKVSGTAQRLSKNRILYHGTLLFDSNPDMIAGALNVDPSKFQGKAAKSVRARVGSIRKELPEDMNLPEFWAYLKEALAGEAGSVEDQLTEEELAQVAAIRDSKYGTWEWTYGSSHPYSMRNKHRWPGGTLEVRMEVEKGIITGIKFYGDFLSLLPLDVPEAAVTGVRFGRATLESAFDKIEIEKYFGTITKEEVIETMIYASAPDEADAS